MKHVSRTSGRIGLCLAILLAMILSTAFVQPARALTSGDFSYTVADGLATITGYAGIGGDVTIPSTLDGYPVVAIGTSAFGGKTSISSLSISEGVTSIGNNAFSSCSSLASHGFAEWLNTHA